MFVQALHMTVIHAKLLIFNAIEWALKHCIAHCTRIPHTYYDYMNNKWHKSILHLLFTINWVNKRRHSLTLVLLVVCGKIIRTFVLALDLFRFVMLVSITISSTIRFFWLQISKHLRIALFYATEIPFKESLHRCIAVFYSKTRFFPKKPKLKWKRNVKRKMGFNILHIFEQICCKRFKCTTRTETRDSRVDIVT